jgi:hypothetical protein
VACSGCLWKTRRFYDDTVLDVGHLHSPYAFIWYYGMSSERISQCSDCADYFITKKSMDDAMKYCLSARSYHSTVGVSP